MEQIMFTKNQLQFKLPVYIKWLPPCGLHQQLLELKMMQRLVANLDRWGQFLC